MRVDPVPAAKRITPRADTLPIGSDRCIGLRMRIRCLLDRYVCDFMQSPIQLFIVRKHIDRIESAPSVIAEQWLAVAYCERNDVMPLRADELHGPSLYRIACHLNHSIQIAVEFMFHGTGTMEHSHRVVQYIDHIMLQVFQVL